VSVPDAAAVAELVRLPAVLTVPGDVLLGAAAAGRIGDARRTAGLVASSSCLYLAGMALNDYADRDVDARERPGRPIPSGRVSPAFALGLATGLTLGGLAAAAAADGAGALRTAAPLAAAVWAYDLGLKPTAAGPAAMSACRAIDVLVGARGALAALPAAAIVAAHTAVVTGVSRHEAGGGGAAAAVARAAAVATGAVALAGAVSGRRPAAPAGRAVSLALVGAYAGAVVRGHAGAAREPSSARLQRAVGTGVLGLIPLEAGLLAGAGALTPALAVAALWPVARAFARRRTVT
jgi:hypothetical protein